MSRWTFHRTLHFRIALLFLALLSVVFLTYSWWIEYSMNQGLWLPGEEEWYDSRREVEAESLAVHVTPLFADSLATTDALAAYGRVIAGYDAEVALIGPNGLVLHTTMPDSLSRVLVYVSPTLLDSMTAEDWDFESYPYPAAIDAYENRINDVVPIFAGGDSTAAPDAWLVSSFRPVNISMEEIERDERTRNLRGAAAILLSSFLGGLVIMTWVSRRIRSLSLDLATFRDGDFEHRARGRAADEIGALERSFNSMADRLTGVIGRLRQSEDYRRQLTANISHDLRTPMASLRGYVETLTLRGQDLTDEEREHHLRTITSNLDNLEGLIERLFELTRLESGQVQYRREAFSLEELAADVLGRLESRSRDADVALNLDAEAGLPLVHADPLRIGQVLQNLADNAIKFNRRGGEVRVSLRRLQDGPGDGVAVEVGDTGIGIGNDDLPHVFERFYTVDKSRSGNTGSGLGLAIAHQIVSGHGSDLTVESREGGGTTFRFSLPAAVPD
ncbi:MAG: HAMP domain-containing histidine kinase [bacterium]|nr:HAMP domain-containing histidine kinase [bacterium]